MKNLFAAAIIGFASQAIAQDQACEGANCGACGADGRGCTPNIVDMKPVDVNPPAQEISGPGVYINNPAIGPGNPYKGAIQFGSESNRDVRIGYAENSQWAWRRACCKDPV